MTISGGTDAISPVQAAVNGVLSADATLAGLATGGVVAYLPQSPSYPYVRIETPSEESNDTMGKQGGDVLVSVHVFDSYSAQRGDARALAIVNRVKALLRYVTLTVSGYSFIACRYDRTRNGGDDVVNGVPLSHYVVDFTVMVREA